MSKIIWKIEKIRYSPKFYWNRETNQQEFRGYYVSKKETVYRDGKGAVTLSVNSARQENANARLYREKCTDRAAYGTYYSVRAWPVTVLDVPDEPSITELPPEVEGV
jgi:hypothetical protein